MMESGSDELKGSPETSTFATDTPQTAQTKKNQSVVLVPQPSNDPEDPLVCARIRI